MRRTKNSTMKRITSILLSAVMMLSSVQSIFAAQVESFTDFPTGWSRPAMEAAVDNGLLVGFENNEIRPKNNLTRAEMAAVMARAFGAITMADISAYTDVAYDAWYYESIAKAVQMGAMTGKSATQMCPNCNITREEAFSVLGRILALSDADTSVLSKFYDAASVSSWAAGNIAALVRRGYVNGDDLGNLNPKANITREEFAQVMYTTIKRYITEAGTYSEEMQGIVVLRTGNINLANMKVNGDLVVGDGAMKLPVKLTAVAVNGRFLTRGGTMTLNNTTVSDGVVVLNPNGVTHFNNYRNESVFAGINEITRATFLSRSTVQSGGGSSVSTKYYVTFKLDEDDTEDYAKFRVVRGSRIGSNMPDDPVRTGYTFEGWFDGDGNEVTADTRVNEAMTVTALFSLKEYDIAFKNEDESAFSYFIDEYLPDNKFDIETPYVLPDASKVDRLGYTFIGWVDADGNPVTEIVVTAETPDEGIALYADFDLIEYPVYYKNVDETDFSYFVEGYVPEATFNIEEDYVLPDASKVDCLGYTFNGWVDADGNPVTELEVTEETTVDGITLYPDFELVNYPISYKNADETDFSYFVEDYVPGATFNIEEDYVLPDASKVDRLGYTFNGWVDADGNPAVVEVTDETTDAGMVVYADFTINEYKLRFEAEFADGADYKEVTYTILNYGSVTFPGESELIIPDGMESLLGWYKADGTEVTFLDESFITDEVGTIVLTPRFSEEETIKVTFYNGYGEYEMYLEELNLEVNDEGVAVMTETQVPSYPAKTDVLKKSKYMPTNYPDYEGVLTITPSFWYEVDGKLVPFEAPIELTEDTDVHLMYQNFALNANVTDLPPVAITAKYNADTRLMNSVKVLGDGAVNWLILAKTYPKYTEIVDRGIGKLVDLDIMDENRNLKMLYLPIKVSYFTTEEVTNGMVKTRIREMIAHPETLDELLEFAHIDELLEYIDRNPIAGGLTGAQPDEENAIEIIKDYIELLDSDGKRELADDIYRSITATEEYKTLIEDLFEMDEIVIIPEDVPYVKAISHAIRDLSMKEAIAFTHNKYIEKLIDLIGEDFITDRFDETKYDYCDALDEVIEVVESGASTYETYTTSLRLRVNPIDDILVRLYDKALPIAEEKLMNANVYYEDNEYLQYILEHDVIERLVSGDGEVDGEYIGYAIKDEADYAKYVMEMLIAADDAICWYGDEENLTPEQVDAIYNAVVAKAQIVHEKLNKLLEEYSETGELPDIAEQLITKVQKINDLFIKYESKIRKVIDKYLAHSINDKIQDGSIAESEKASTAIDILLGRENPVFTIDCLYDVFYRYDDKMQAKLKELVDSGKLEDAIDKAFDKVQSTDKITDRIDADKIEKLEELADKLYEIIVNIANNGIDEYKVNTDDIPTIIDQYELTIGDNVFTMTRSLQ